MFRDADLFAREWRKLLRAHAVEAYSKASSAGVPEAKLRAEVVALLAAAADARGLVRGNAGVGQRFEFRVDRYRGAALGYESRVVHVAIL